jgi:hypothetical protein
MDGFSVASGAIGKGLAGNVLNCLQPIAAGKAVAVWGGDPTRCGEALVGAVSIQRAPRRRWPPGGVLLCIDSKRVVEFCRLPITAAALAAGDLVVALSDTPRPPGAPETPYGAHYTCRVVKGTVVQDSRFVRNRVLTAQTPGVTTAPDVHILMWSTNPLPALASGLYEWGAFGKPAFVGSASEARTGVGERPARGAVALANRLLKVEDRTVGLRSEILALKTRLAERAGSGSGAYSHLDIATARQPWPLAEVPTRDLATLGLYDRRPDDAVVGVAQAGLKFMEAHGLLGQAPDFEKAVVTLNAMSRVLALEPEVPDVSIVIPI